MNKNAQLFKMMKIKFLDEGELKSHPEFGTSIVYNVIQDGEESKWYVKADNYSLLGQLKTLGKLTDKEVEVTTQNKIILISESLEEAKKQNQQIGKELEAHWSKDEGEFRIKLLKSLEKIAKNLEL